VWVGILNFAQRVGVARQRGAWSVRVERIDRRFFVFALAVAKPHRVASAEHDMVGTGAAVHGLMVIVTHRIGVGECFQVRCITLLDIVEAHRGRTLAGRLVGEGRRRRRAVRTGADCHFDPWEQIGFATPAVFSVGCGGVAIELLPHLIKAMDRARRVGVVWEGLRSDLERSGLQIASVAAVVGDAGIRNVTRLAGPARQEIFVIIVRETDGLDIQFL